MKRIAIVLCAALAAGVLTGCDPSFLPRSQDISHVELVRTLAIDDSREKDRIKVTVASGVKRGPDGSPGKPLVLTEEAETVFSACQMIQKSGQRHVTYGPCDRMRGGGTGGPGGDQPGAGLYPAGL